MEIDNNLTQITESQITELIYEENVVEVSVDDPLYNLICVQFGLDLEFFDLLVCMYQPNQKHVSLLLTF